MRLVLCINRLDGDCERVPDFQSKPGLELANPFSVTGKSVPSSFETHWLMFTTSDKMRDDFVSHSNELRSSFLFKEVNSDTNLGNVRDVSLTKQLGNQHK